MSDLSPLRAGDWQGLLLRVFAPHRGALCIGDCMGLNLGIFAIPPGVTCPTMAWPP